LNYIFITQVYPPDPAAVGQYFEDVTMELALRGHNSVVYTADKDYDNPKIRYEAVSPHPSIRVVRVPFSSFGKRTIGHRLLGQVSFLFQVLTRLLFCSKPDGVVLTTIPATTGVFFLLAQGVRRFRYVYWVMDINPDQAIALGAFSEKSIPARFLAWVNRRLISGADAVVYLDQDMLSRLDGAGPQPAGSPGGNMPPPAKFKLIPPWPLDRNLQRIPKNENPFVSEHGLTDTFVFMYSGNHSLVHPLGTLLDVLEKSGDGNLSECTFAFIGGGRGKERVEESASRIPPGNARYPRILSLPYQPLDQIKYSLSAADVQVVSFGDEMVGIVHPSKIYGAMALGQPVLLLGSERSALWNLVMEHNIGWCVPHGDTDQMRRTLKDISETSVDTLSAMGERAKRLAASTFSQKKLCGEFCGVVENITDTATCTP
jgi:glycosyltransferase involved in cell wall biosynthesis